MPHHIEFPGSHHRIPKEMGDTEFLVIASSNNHVGLHASSLVRPEDVKVMVHEVQSMTYYDTGGRKAKEARRAKCRYSL